MRTIIILGILALQAFAQDHDPDWAQKMEKRTTPKKVQFIRAKSTGHGSPYIQNIRKMKDAKKGKSPEFQALMDNSIEYVRDTSIDLNSRRIEDLQKKVAANKSLHSEIQSIHKCMNDTHRSNVFLTWFVPGYGVFMIVIMIVIWNRMKKRYSKAQ